MLRKPMNGRGAELHGMNHSNDTTINELINIQQYTQSIKLLNVPHAIVHDIDTPIFIIWLCILLLSVHDILYMA